MTSFIYGVFFLNLFCINTYCILYNMFIFVIV